MNSFCVFGVGYKRSLRGFGYLGIESILLPDMTFCIQQGVGKIQVQSANEGDLQEALAVL